MRKKIMAKIKELQAVREELVARGEYVKADMRTFAIDILLSILEDM